jgi:hypothetical protein
MGQGTSVRVKVKSLGRFGCESFIKLPIWKEGTENHLRIMQSEIEKYVRERVL